jgi:hypothetical protein
VDTSGSKVVRKNAFILVKRFDFLIFSLPLRSRNIFIF